MATQQIAVLKPYTALWTPSRFKVFYGGRGGGKCVGRGTPVVMADGSIRPIEEVQAGDRLMGPDSKPRQVVAVTRGHGPLFHVRQKTGMDYVVNDHHVLALKRSRSAREDFGEFSPAGKPQRPCGRYARYGVETTFISAADYCDQSERFKANVFGFKVPLDFEAREVPVDPYFLGLWLGDGDADRLAVVSADREILDFLRRHGEEVGMEVREDEKAGTSAIRMRFVNGGRLGSIRDDFKAMNLFHNKHLPERYIVNDRAVRLALLAGLMDSDGYLHNGCYDIVQKSKRIAQDIKRLADTLGFKTSIRSRTATCNGKSFEVWRVNIGGDVDRIPCRVARKRAKVKKNKDWRKTRIDVEPIGKGNYYGVELDGDHLFVLGDGTVTHNSHACAQEIIKRCAERRLRVMCCREIQKSIDASVKQLLDDKIELLGLTDFFTSTRDEIRAPNGSKIFFYGLRNNSEKVKSTEGVDICWGEEAESMSEFSLDLLIPTIRKKGSELWFTFNPYKEKDPIYSMFVGGEPPPGSIVVKTSFRDNPLLDEEQHRHRLWMKKRDPDKYRWIWEGECLKRSDRLVFSNWEKADLDEEMPLGLPPMLGADWGFSVDPTVLLECYVWGDTLYFKQERWVLGCETLELPSFFAGSDWREPERWKNPKNHPGLESVRNGSMIVADSSSPERISHVSKAGLNIRGAVRGPRSVEEGIEFMRAYDLRVHPRCTHMLDELRSYSYKTDPHTDEVMSELEDKNNHLIDAARYAVESLRRARRKHLAMVPPEIVEVEQPSEWAVNN